MIPELIHLICLPPYPKEIADSNINRIRSTNPTFKVMVHTEVPKDFIFKDMPATHPAVLCDLLRMDILRRFGGWYMDLDVDVYCDLNKLAKMIGLGDSLAISLMNHAKQTVCTFVSCCPENWNGWDTVVDFIKKFPEDKKSHYCTKVMGRLIKKTPYFIDLIPPEFLYTMNWLKHTQEAE